MGASRCAASAGGSGLGDCLRGLSPCSRCRRAADRERLGDVRQFLAVPGRAWSRWRQDRRCSCPKAVGARCLLGRARDGRHRGHRGFGGQGALSPVAMAVRTDHPRLATRCRSLSGDPAHIGNRAVRLVLVQPERRHRRHRAHIECKNRGEAATAQGHGKRKASVHRCKVPRVIGVESLIQRRVLRGG